MFLPRPLTPLDVVLSRVREDIWLLRVAYPLFADIDTLTLVPSSLYLASDVNITAASVAVAVAGMRILSSESLQVSLSAAAIAALQPSLNSQIPLYLVPVAAYLQNTDGSYASVTFSATSVQVVYYGLLVVCYMLRHHSYESIAASIDTVYLDMFNRQIVVNYDAPVVVASVDASKFLLKNSNQTIPLNGTAFTALNSTSVAIPFDNAFYNSVVNLYESWSPLTLFVPNGTVTYQSSILAAIGVFTVELYCWF